MKEKFNSVKEKLKTVWGGLAKAAKILIISALIVIIVGSVGLTVFLNKKSSSDWIVLFPDMSQEESTEVYLELQNRGVDIVSGGTDNHLMLVDLKKLGVTGKEMENLLDEAN